jgi:hypothetical protein
MTKYLMSNSERGSQRETFYFRHWVFRHSLKVVEPEVVT